MSVASKNLFELLGNDDGDSDNTGPVKTVDKTSTRTAKRNTDGAAPATKTPAAPPARRGGFSGSEAAFRDRGAGADRNRAKSTDDNARGGARGGSGARMRGGRGARYPRDRDDRHSKGLPSGEKQAGNEGDAEMKDEQAGEEIAKKDEKEAATEDATGEGDGEPAEPEDKSISYDTYLAQIAEKKMALGSESKSVRKANEGSKLNKQWAAAKPLVKDEDDEFISGTGGKAKRERERKTKQLVEIDNRFVEERGGGRGGRGGSGGPRPDRGGRGGRGGGSGPRSDAPRGGGSGPRSDAPRGGGGGPGRGRGGGGGRGGGPSGGPSGGPHIPVEDPNVFPELGS